MEQGWPFGCSPDLGIAVATTVAKWCRAWGSECGFAISAQKTRSRTGLVNEGSIASG